MQPKINKLWHQLETQRIQLFQELSKYDNHQLNKKPNPEAWSVLQVAHHVMSAEATSLEYMRKKLSFTSQIPKAGFRSHLRLLSLKFAFALPLKYKAPAKIEAVPEVSDFNDLKLRWASQRLDLQGFIESLPDNVLEGELWRHQIFGKMTIAQMLDFFYDHAKRHESQIERTLKQI